MHVMCPNKEIAINFVEGGVVVNKIQFDNKSRRMFILMFYRSTVHFSYIGYFKAFCMFNFTHSLGNC